MKDTAGTDRGFTEKVLKAYSDIEDPRLKFIVAVLIKNLHACVKEMKVTDEEWEFAWDFMRRMAEITGPERFYENQDENQPDYNLRGRFRTDENGTFELIALMPTAYPAPIDGPAGELLRAARRSPYRASAHPLYRGGSGLRNARHPGLCERRPANRGRCSFYGE